jgi:hypothetical protein
MGREINVGRSIAWETRVRKEKRAEAMAADMVAQGLASIGRYGDALPGRGMLARACAQRANDTLAERWQGTAYAPTMGTLGRPGEYAYRGALQRNLLPPMAAPAAPAKKAGGSVADVSEPDARLPSPHRERDAWRPLGPSPLTGYSTSALAPASHEALRPLPPPAPRGVAGLPLAGIRLGVASPVPVTLRSMPLGSKAARAERDAEAALLLGSRILAAYDARSDAVKARAGQWPDLR